jgi:hypothetical protein
MSGLREILERHAITTPRFVDRRIMAELPVAAILDIADELAQLTPLAPQGTGQFGAFDFVTDSITAGQYGYGCITPECRLKRSSELGAFAALYCDSVYLGNYFTGMSLWETADSRSEHQLRETMACNLKMMLQLLPLMERNIVHLVKPCFGQCTMFPGAVPVRVRRELAAHTDRLAELMEGKCTGKMEMFDDGPMVSVEGLSGLSEHGTSHMHYDEIPSWFYHSVIKHQRPRKMSRSKIVETGLVRELVVEALEDSLRALNASQILKAKYLTQRAFDAQILSGMPDSGVAATTTAAMAHMSHAIPFLQNLGPDAVLKVRDGEQDAFLSYRMAVGKALKAASEEKLSARIVTEIYNDVIRPELDRLDARADKLSRRALFHGAGTAALCAVGLSIGLATGIVPATAAGVFGSFGGLSAISGMAGGLGSLSQAKQELENSDFYFLWRLRRKSKRRRA